MTLRSPPLFWRTLLLVLLLIVASLAAWLQSFRVFERAPRAETIAQQVASIAQLTRAALLYADPYVRRDLLAELARNEGIRIAPLEPGDQVVPVPDRPVLRLAEQSIVARLGPGTRVATAVNGQPGLWVSLTIEDDQYWLYIDRDPVARNIGTQWIGWAAVAVLLSVLGAILITRVINRPLAQLSAAARELGLGRTPAPLPASGPIEIRTVNESFNRMVGDLGKLEEDRAVLLAGISHDLRTPLTRLRLELEMAELPPATRQAMVGDLEQMDAIVRQFLDFARRAPQQPAERIELSALLESAVARARVGADPQVTLNLMLARDVWISGHRTELDRAIDNLLTNALRYGRDPATQRLELTVSLSTDGQDALVAVADHGPGVPADQIDRLLRPFERGDSARSDGGAAGLGLPIVQRIARLHGGGLRLLANAPHGLRAELTLPLEIV
ncbi:MAG: ATP-binding protein [Burkholderiaceae bacterium]|jgi:two-component system osmolarity sensor histidine kinase EnvZ|nr:ATP-binding protein [Burkholderiaceae bacterium]